jgi:hypothetical protein
MAHRQSRQPPPRGRPGRLAVLAAVLLHAAAASPTAAATLLDSLAGRWASDAGTALAMEWSPQDGGFNLRMSVPGGGEVQATFEPSDRPGIFFTERDQGWGMFGSETPPNPLRDGPLQWARATPDTIYVYRVAIDAKGGFVIDRYACRPEGDALDVDFQRRLPGGRTEESRLRLKRARS